MVTGGCLTGSRGIGSLRSAQRWEGFDGTQTAAGLRQVAGVKQVKWSGEQGTAFAQVANGRPTITARTERCVWPVIDRHRRPRTSCHRQRRHQHRSEAVAGHGVKRRGQSVAPARQEFAGEVMIRMLLA